MEERLERALDSLRESEAASAEAAARNDALRQELLAAASANTGTWAGGLLACACASAASHRIRGGHAWSPVVQRALPLVATGGF